MVLTLCYSARVDQTSTEKLVDELERDLIKKTEELEIVKDKLSDRELEVQSDPVLWPKLIIFGALW